MNGKIGYRIIWIQQVTEGLWEVDNEKIILFMVGTKFKISVNEFKSKLVQSLNLDGSLVLPGSLANAIMKKKWLENVFSIRGRLSTVLIWLYLVKMRVILKKKTVLIHIPVLCVEIRVYCLKLISQIVLCHCYIIINFELLKII